MAQYLDLTGLTALWKKIKATFAKKPTGRKDYFHLGNALSWASFKDTGRRHIYIFTHFIVVKRHEGYTVTLKVNGKDVSGSAVEYNEEAPLFFNIVGGKLKDEEGNLYNHFYVEEAEEDNTAQTLTLSLVGYYKEIPNGFVSSNGHWRWQDGKKFKILPPPTVEWITQRFRSRNAENMVLYKWRSSCRSVITSSEDPKTYYLGWEGTKWETGHPKDRKVWSVYKNELRGNLKGKWRVAYLQGRKRSPFVEVLCREGEKGYYLRKI